MADDPGFDIPSRPSRQFSSRGDLEYEGGSRFDLVPDGDGVDGLRTLVEAVLADGPYRYGDFNELPMPLYLVRDDDTTDVFRVSVRDGTVRLHVLPETEPDGLRRFFERLRRRTDCEWSVACEELG